MNSDDKITLEDLILFSNNIVQDKYFELNNIELKCSDESIPLNL